VTTYRVGMCVYRCMCPRRPSAAERWRVYEEETQ
jgi:hypothetical protein